jgi:hypothetical protein
LRRPVDGSAARLGADPRFNLRQSYWLINGIAGISPADGTIGSAVWTDFVVNGDLAKEIDPRQIPQGWPEGFLSLDASTQSGSKGGAGWEDDVRQWTGTEARANRRGNVIRLTTALMNWAYRLTKDIRLPESEAMKALRTRYTSSAGTRTGPIVQIGANLATEIFWHGSYMDAWAHRWVNFETDGVAKLGTTAMNDSGASGTHETGQSQLGPRSAAANRKQLRYAPCRHDPSRESRDRSPRLIHRISAIARSGIFRGTPHRRGVAEIAERREPLSPGLSASSRNSSIWQYLYLRCGIFIVTAVSC